MVKLILTFLLMMLSNVSLAQKSWEPVTVFSVELNADGESEQKVAVELYCIGSGGLFLKIDGKMAGKVVMVDVDPKFTFKRYLANWDHVAEKFNLSLEHMVRDNEAGEITPTGWKLSWDQKNFSARSPDVKLFPNALAAEHTMNVKVRLGEKDGGGGINGGDLRRLLYPLPISFDQWSDGKIESTFDSIAGKKNDQAKFLISSKIPSDHVLSYLRATRIVSRVIVGSDLLDK